MNNLANHGRSLSADLIARFASVVGDRNAITDATDIVPYVTEERGFYQGSSRLVLRPGTTEEVSEICRIASETRTPLVPQGGNTGLVGGQFPFHGEIVLSLRRLNRIREIDARSGTLTCEAGVVLAAAQASAESVGCMFPLSLGAEGSCTIGGNLSTNAGGNAALCFGVARDLVSGLEVVLADGRIMRNLSKLKKDNTGYDLRNLFIGAEGTLGIITAAVLKLQPRPRSMATAFIGMPSPEAALRFLSMAREQVGSTLTSFELISDICVAFSLRHASGVRAPLDGRPPWSILIEISSHQNDAKAAMEGLLMVGVEVGLVEHAVIAQSLEQRKAFWHLRESIAWVQRFEGASIKHDISVPVAAVAEFIAEANDIVERLAPGSRPYAFGHLGDGNIHYNVSQPVLRDAKDFLGCSDRIHEAVHGIAVGLGGSISAEHGIGIMKRNELSNYKDIVVLDMMRKIKAMLDPLNILNPGKVI